jgi:hypothetical protein
MGLHVLRCQLSDILQKEALMKLAYFSKLYCYKRFQDPTALRCDSITHNSKFALLQGWCYGWYATKGGGLYYAGVVSSGMT